MVRNPCPQSIIYLALLRILNCENLIWLKILNSCFLIIWAAQVTMIGYWKVYPVFFSLKQEHLEWTLSRTYWLLTTFAFMPWLTGPPGFLSDVNDLGMLLYLSANILLIRHPHWHPHWYNALLSAWQISF